MVYKHLATCGFAALLISALVAGCGNGEPTGIVQSVPNLPGLRQVVTIDTTIFKWGDSVHVRSVLRNEGRHMLNISVASCGRLLGGTLEFALINVCSHRWDDVTVTPGDSNVQSAIREVISPPGEYVLDVVHVWDPEGFAVRIDVTVIPN